MRSWLSAFVVFPLAASAFELRVDSQGDVVRWRREVTFVVDPGLGQALGEPRALSAVVAAVAELEDATPALTVTVKEGPVRGVGFELSGRNQNEIFALADWPYTDGALASTVVTVNARTDEILDTDIVFNAEQQTFRVLDERPARGDLDDVQNTLTHELGHALGLMHNAMDERVVMYPRAAAGEVGKRVLQDDDRQGLVTLYGSPGEVTPVALRAAGCSATGSSTGWLALALVVRFTLRRARRAQALVVASRSPASSRRFALASALLGSLFVAASAGAQERSPVLTGVVRASVTHRSGDAPGLIVTSLDVRLVTCVGAAPCEAQVRVTVPGGRLGELEQRVEHHPVPAVGETLGLAQRRGRWVVYRLADRDEAQRFEALCSGSAAPQAGRGAPGARAQPSAVAR